MMQGTTKTIRIQDLIRIKTELEKLEVKEKEVFSQKEAVLYLKDVIEELIEKNYSFEEISEILRSQSFEVSALTMKKWVYEKNRNQQTKNKRKKNAKEQSQTEEKRPSVINEKMDDPKLAHDVQEEPVIRKEENIPEKEVTTEEQQTGSAHFEIKEDTPL